MVTTLPRLGRGALRAIARPVRLVVQLGGRRLVRRIVGLVLIVVTVRASLGVWPAALVGAMVVTVRLLVAWATVERCITERAGFRSRPVVVERRPRAPGHLDGDHVAFARGLAGLAAWYLAECERQEREALR